MLKKISLLFSLMVLSLLCSIGASAGFLVDDKPYVEDEKTKIIDHVVYKLYEYPKGNKYYEVYDWFDTYEASETVEEINIVPEIDGIKVTKIQNIEPLCDPEYWKNKNYSVKKVTIPDTITEIGSYFFSVLDGVEELTIPASVKKFTGDGITDCGEMTTFVEMESLKKITFLGNLEELGGFYNCPKLETVVLKGTVYRVATAAFYKCTSLKNFDFSKIKGWTGNSAFSNTGFTSVTIPAEALDDTMFESCKKLTKVVITANKDNIYIDSGAFYNCTALKTVTFPKPCKDLTIQEDAFRNCKSLQAVKFPSTCKKLTIEDDAFRNCTSLKTVTFPKSDGTVEIGYRAFRNCKNLTKVYNTANIEKIYGGAFRDCASLTSFTISDKTKFIGKNAFYGCKKLKTVTVNSKNNAPKIYQNAFKNTASGIKFIAKNETAAKKWKSALTKSGLKNMKVAYVKYTYI